MGNEIEPIIFGGAKLYNYEKKDVKYDNKNNPIYCVWLPNGVYAEYPEQKNRNIASYYATEVKSGITHPITKSTYDSKKTTKDGTEHEFKVEVEEYPSLDANVIGKVEEKDYYEYFVDGFNGIKVEGSQSPENIYISNTTDADIIADNDKEKDNVNIMINCKKVKAHVDKFIDSISRWAGYEKKNGYFANYKSQ